jgi:hypothetical protein
MKYVANPVIVDAYKIVEIIRKMSRQSITLILDNNDEVIANPEMLARYIPVVGDYWIIQSNGYIYLNPKDVFERKYSSLDLADEAIKKIAQHIIEKFEPVLDSLK